MFQVAKDPGWEDEPVLQRQVTVAMVRVHESSTSAGLRWQDWSRACRRQGMRTPTNQFLSNHTHTHPFFFFFLFIPKLHLWSKFWLLIVICFRCDSSSALFLFCFFCYRNRIMIGYRMRLMFPQSRDAHTLFRIGATAACKRGERVVLGKYLAQSHGFHHLITTQVKMKRKSYTLNTNAEFSATVPSNKGKVAENSGKSKVILLQT